MLWPLILPVQLTCVLLGAAFLIALYVAHRRKWPESRTIIIAIVCLPLLFVPACVAVSTVVDYTRFGMFAYSDFSSIGDFRVERYMPRQATDIHVFKHYGGNGYRARFSIVKEDLENWHNNVWNLHGEKSVGSRPENDMSASVDAAEFDRWFAEFQWSQPADLVTYSGPVAGNGAHYTVWYSDSDQKAFLTSCYW